MRSCHRIADPFRAARPPSDPILIRLKNTTQRRVDAGFGRERADLEGSSRILEAAPVVRG